ncbi:MAG: DUF1577 domain-containing protein, partial [Spirochaetota bacterium]
MAVGRSDSLQELITLMDSVYGETIIGSDINLIKHLFYYLKSENTEFEVEYEERHMPVRVEAVNTDTVSLNVLGFEDQGTRRAKIKFEVINVLYVFEVIINDIKENIVYIRIPTELQSAEMRKHRRVVCDDLFMNFIILFRSFKGGRYISGDNIYAERRFTHLFREIRNDEPNLKLMNLMLTDYITKVSGEYELVIYREGDGNEKLQELLSRDLKSVFVQDCANIESYISKIEHDSIKSYSQWYEEIEREIDEFEAITFFEELRKKESRNFYVSYIISPLTMFDKVIGHLKVYTTAMDKHLISLYDSEYIHEMAEISSYGFTKIAIKGNRFNTLYTNTKILDISISGLRFEIYDEKLYQYLRKHNTIKMYIPIGQRTLVINGEILRYEESIDSYRMGVNYFSSNPDDMKILENYI